MIYQEFLPSPPLRKYIRMYARLECGFDLSGPYREVTPPYLCKGLMFYYRQDQPVRVSNGQVDVDLPGGFVLTQALRPNEWEIAGPFGVFAVIFQPGQFRRFFPFSTTEFLDKYIRFDDLSAYGLPRLHEQMVLTSSTSARIRLANRHFEACLPEAPPGSDATDRFLHRLFRRLDQPVSRLQTGLGRSERHFRRTFRQDVGLSPKQYQILLRFSVGFHLLQSGQYDRFTDIAYTCGYFDQSEYIAAFRRFTRSTPAEYLQQQADLAEAISWKDEAVGQPRLIY